MEVAQTAEPRVIDEPIAEGAAGQSSSSSSARVMASSGTVGSVSISLHPLVITNVRRHSTKLDAQEGKLVYGAVMGKQKGRNIEIMNSFELLITLIGDDVLIDRDFYDKKKEQFKEVFSDMDFLGWYTTGGLPNEKDYKVHKQICEINESPVMLKLDPRLQSTDQLPVSIYESVIHLVNGKATMLFVPLTCTLATEEAERIGVDHVARMCSNEQGERINLIIINDNWSDEIPQNLDSGYEFRVQDDPLLIEQDEKPTVKVEEIDIDSDTSAEFGDVEEVSESLGITFTQQFLSLIKTKGYIKAVKLILDDCHCYYSVDEQGATFLHYAVEYGNFAVTNYLLKKGFDVNARDLKGKTPLMTAVEKLRRPLLSILFNAGANMDIKDNFGCDALDLALSRHPSNRVLKQLFYALKQKYSSEQIAKRLMRSNCQLGSAAYAKDAKVVEYMIERGVPINLTGQYPLHVAVEMSDVETVKLLLENEAAVEALDDDGATPLYYLCRYLGNDIPKQNILDILLKRGATLTTCTSSGYFNARSALMDGHKEVVRLILQHVDFTARQISDGATVLHLLAYNRTKGVVDELKPYVKKFDVNARSRCKHGPLSWATLGGNISMAKFLLDQGAKIDVAVFFSAYSARRHPDPVVEAHRDRCVEFLLRHSADPQILFTARNLEYINILDIALKNKQFGRIKFALAQLAIHEKQGVVVRDLTRFNIDSHRSLKTYFTKCRRLLGKEIFGSMSLFELLTADEKKNAKFFNNDDLVWKLKRLGQKKNLRFVCEYYYRIMKNCFSKGLVNRKLRNRLAEIVSEISRNRLIPRHIATESIIDFFTNKELRRLC